MRGFFGGLIVGVALLVGAVVMLSLVAPVTTSPQAPDVTATAPVSVGAGVPTEETTAETADVESRGTDSDLVEMAPTAPASDAGVATSDSPRALDQAATQPLGKPSVGAATEGLTDPDAVSQETSADVNTDAPVVPTAPLGVPEAPQGDIQPAAASDPAQPVVQDAPKPNSGFEAALTTEDTLPELATQTDPTPKSVADSTTELAPAAEAEVAPVPEIAPGAPSEPAAPPVPDIAEITRPGTPQVSSLPQAGAESAALRPRIGTPVVPLVDRGASSTSARATAPVADTPSGPPIKAYGVPFDNPDAKPMMAIVLIDTEDGIGTEALVDFPYPLTFAIDPSAPGAAEKMARHRAAGAEVVALIDLPEAATAQDAEVTLSVWLQSLPEVVAVLEGIGSGLQGNRALSNQVTEIVDAAGLGLIMQPKGLNTAQKLATGAGVPSALVFRDFDRGQKSPDAIRRFLDQAAFRAGQQGGVIMLGRVRPDTISALVLWGLQDRASRVALAPVSAVLMRAR